MTLRSLSLAALLLLSVALGGFACAGTDGEDADGDADADADADADGDGDSDGGPPVTDCGAALPLPASGGTCEVVAGNGTPTRLVVRDVTPHGRNGPPEMTEAERWRQAGLTPDGTPLDLSAFK